MLGGRHGALEWREPRSVDLQCSVDLRDQGLTEPCTHLVPARHTEHETVAPPVIASGVEYPPAWHLYSCCSEPHSSSQRAFLSISSISAWLRPTSGTSDGVNPPAPPCATCLLSDSKASNHPSAISRTCSSSSNAGAQTQLA